MQRAVLAAPHGLVVIDALAAPQPLEDHRLLVELIRGDQDVIGLPITSSAA